MSVTAGVLDLDGEIRLAWNCFMLGMLFVGIPWAICDLRRSKRESDELFDRMDDLIRKVNDADRQS